MENASEGRRVTFTGRKGQSLLADIEAARNDGTATGYKVGNSGTLHTLRSNRKIG